MKKKKLNGTFDYRPIRPTRPTRPTRPIKLGLRPRFRKGYHWAPGGTLWLLSRLKCWLLISP